MRITTLTLKVSLLIVVFAGVTCSVWAQYSPPTNGLVAWWRGEGNATDSVGGHDGTLNGGMGFANGVFGQAFACATGKRVFVPDSPAFQLTSLSIGAWVNIHADSWTVLQRDGANVAPYNFSSYNNGRIGLSINGYSSTDTLSTPISYNRWHQVTATFDASLGTISVYIDGVLAAQKSTTTIPATTLTSPSGIAIGNTPFYEFPLLGEVDEVVLYSRALSSNEVMTLATPPPCLTHGATAVAQVVNGFVVGATITDGGCGYTNTPLVSIQGGGGTGATATAVVSNGVVVSITITDAGIGYTNTPAIYIASPTGPQVTLIKAVKPAFSDLLIGGNYQLQISADLNTWTNQGSPFTATNPSMIYPQYWDVENWGQLFFRLQVVP